MKTAARTESITKILAVGAFALLLAASAGVAQDATWNGPRSSASWLIPGNWSPNSVPTGTALFLGTTAASEVTFSSMTAGTTSIQTIQFLAGAQSYTISVGTVFSNQVLSINGSGITNSSSNTQNFRASLGDSIVFNNNATAGSNTAFGIGGGAAASLQFNDTSSAGGASISNFASGSTTFNDDSSAGDATISSSGSGGSAITFNNTSGAGTSSISSTAGAPTIFNDTSSAESAAISNSSSGSTMFNDDSSAGEFQTPRMDRRTSMTPREPHLGYHEPPERLDSA